MPGTPRLEQQSPHMGPLQAKFILWSVGALLAISLMAITGWQVQSTTLVQILPGLAPMQVNTALCFLLFGIFILSMSRNWLGIARACAFLAGAISFATLSQHMLHVDLYLDTLLANPFIADRTMVPGRMSPATAISFSIASIGAVWHALQTTRRTPFPMVTLAALLVIAFTGTHIVNYLADPEGSFAHHGMAVHTIACFLLLAAGMVALVHPELRPYLTAAHKQAEDLAQQRSLELMQQAFDQIPIGIAVKGQNGELRISNRSFTAFQGATILEHASAGERALARPQDRKGFDELDRSSDETVLQGGKSVHFPDMPLLNAEGIERWISMFKVPLRDSDGLVRGLIWVRDDITQRKEAEEELRSSQQRYSSIVELIGDAIITTDENLNIVLFNGAAEQIFGYSRDELLGHPVNLLWPEELRDEYTQAMRNHRDGVGELRGMSGKTARGLRKDGTTFPAESGVFKFSHAHRDHFTMTIRDISSAVAAKEADRRHAEELEAVNQQMEVVNVELAKSNKELEQFAYVASHDLQEPLRKLTTYSELLREDLEDNVLSEDAQKDLAILEGSAQRMRNLVDALLSFSRLGHAGVKQVEVPLEKCADEAIAVLELRIAERSARIIRSPLPTVVGDHVLLVQLLQNLIGNALKFSNEASPEVRISATVGEETAIISIQDNGIGIAEKYHSSIFEPFKRLHTRSEFEGSGIGLAICAKIAELLGGRIWVASEAGSGAIFNIEMKRHI